MVYFRKIPVKNEKGYKWECRANTPKEPATGVQRVISRRADTKREAEARVYAAIQEIKCNEKT